MRILFATDHIHHPQGGGGAERNTHELCLALQALGHAPAVMASLSPNNTWLSWGNRLRKKIVPRHQFPCDRICGYPSYRGWAENGASEVAARFRPDVVVVQSIRPHALLRQFRDFPRTAYFHEVAQIDHLKGLDVPVLANSPFTARRLKEHCGLDSEVIPPLIEPSFYRTETTRRRVLFVNTVPRKGLEIAFALAESRPDIPFDFVLSWILNKEQISALKARAAKAGNIELHPPRKDMRPLYARARILLAPSQWEETWGRVATEAHSCGIPVLASSQGGLPDSVGPGGIMLPAGDPIEQWQGALSRLWDDEESYRALCAAARDYSRRPEIQPHNIAEKFIRVLHGFVASSRPIQDRRPGVVAATARH